MNDIEKSFVHRAFERNAPFGAFPRAAENRVVQVKWVIVGVVDRIDPRTSARPPAGPAAPAGWCWCTGRAQCCRLSGRVPAELQARC